MKKNIFDGMLFLQIVEEENPEDENYKYPELHLNIWEIEKKSFLDVGLMLSTSEPAKFILLALPWIIKDSNIVDLECCLSNNEALKAVFNESLELTDRVENGGYKVINNFKESADFNIVKFDSSIQCVTEFNTDASIIAIDIEKLKKFSRKINDAAMKMYIRFRLDNLPISFYKVGIEQCDNVFHSSWQNIEIIDFRVNVRRNVPLDLLKKIKAKDFFKERELQFSPEGAEIKFLKFSKVHLFLMKSQSEEIVFEDKWFRSCRSLEDEGFWAKYSNSKDVVVKQSLGYQWSRVAAREGETSFDEYVILARFKKWQFASKRYAFIMLIAGIVGSVIGNLIFIYIPIIIMCLRSLGE